MDRKNLESWRVGEMKLQWKTPMHLASDRVIDVGAHYRASNHAAANNPTAADRRRHRVHLQPHRQEPVDHPPARGDRPGVPAQLQARRARRPAMDRPGVARLPPAPRPPPPPPPPTTRA